MTTFTTSFGSRLRGSRLRGAGFVLGALAFTSGCVGTAGSGDAEGSGGGGGGSGAPSGGKAGGSVPGSGGGQGGTGMSGCAPGAVCSGATEGTIMRRLNRTEYNNTVRDLLQLESLPARAFPAEETVFGFDNNAKALSFPHLLAEQAASAARELASAAVKKAKSFAPCAAPNADAACARTFIENLGKRAWRRPLEAAEVARLEKVFAKGDGFEDGIGLAAQAMFISVPFFYRIEKGQGGATAAATQATSFEMASRLSYLLWNTLPDEALFAEADKDALKTAAQIEAAAKRLLADARSRRTFETFNRQWLQLDPIGLAAKDPNKFPAWNNEYASLLRQSAFAMAADIAAKGKIGDLFTSASVFVNDDLAPYYGIDPPGSATMTKVQLSDASRRAGFLTQGGMLLSHAGFASTSPTFRGKFVREQFLCGVLPKPPPNVNVMIGPAPPDQTTREHYAQHIDNPNCAGCHKPMDPIGFAFEGYDAIGHPRNMENGKPIDATGDASDTDVGTFDGLTELGQRLAASNDVKACVARQWFRYAFGRAEDETADEKTLAALTEAVTSANTYESLVLATVRAEGFREIFRP